MTTPLPIFGGRIAVAIVEWLFILAVLGEFGVAYVALGSVGNGIEETKNWTLFLHNGHCYVDLPSLFRLLPARR